MLNGGEAGCSFRTCSLRTPELPLPPQVACNGLSALGQLRPSGPVGVGCLLMADSGPSANGCNAEKVSLFIAGNTNAAFVRTPE